jgi:hypothetical protein
MPDLHAHTINSELEQEVSNTYCSVLHNNNNPSSNHRYCSALYKRMIDINSSTADKPAGQIVGDIYLISVPV